MITSRVALAVTSLWFVSVLGSPDEKTLGNRISKWLQSRRKELPFSLDPGISVAVLSEHGTRIEVLEGLGVRRQGSSEAATPDTLFEIGSVTKTIVTLALATLVEEGRLRWDDYIADVLGPSFSFGQDQYVRDHVTVRDLLSHRSGLAGGADGFFLTFYYPSHDWPGQLEKLKLGHDFRQTLDYSNTGFALVGEVLRVASNASSWCAAVRARVFAPLGMTASYCDRNAVPTSSERQVAGVHRTSPCDGLTPKMQCFRHHATQAPLLRSYELTRTGGPQTFAWGASNAAGSIISSVNDMSKVVALLLSSSLGSNKPMVPQIVGRGTLLEMVSAQMVAPASWVAELGISGNDFAAGLGFDLVGRLPLLGFPSSLAGALYAEKSGDTSMHKARLALNLEHGVGVFILSNLGGHAGDSMTALRSGLLALATGAQEDEADLFMNAVMNATDYWQTTFSKDAMCTACGTVLGRSGPCTPGNSTRPSLPLKAFTGTYGNTIYGDLLSIGLSVDGVHLLASFGPFSGKLEFGPNNSITNAACVALGLPVTGRCDSVEFSVPQEMPGIAISNRNQTISFPWGMIVPLPDPMIVTLTVAEDTGTAWAYGVADSALQRISVAERASPEPFEGPWAAIV